MADTTLHVVGISGSLRRASYNTATLRTAIEMAPAGMAIEPFDIRPVPFYDEDVKEKGFPAPAQDLRERIRAADAVLICTPEYNYSIPGVLKNAVDWASRPPDQPWDRKPVALVSASPSFIGGARAQYHLRQALVFLNPFVMNRPEVMISSAHEKFDESGKLTDDRTRAQLSKFLDAFQAFTLEVQRGIGAPKG